MQREQPIEANSGQVTHTGESDGCDEAVRWTDPTPARDFSAENEPLSLAQIDSWRERGFALVDDVLPRALLERARKDALEIFPEPGSPESRSLSDFGSGGRLSFPATRASLNEITLHPRVLGAVAQLLGEEICDLRLTQSDLWPKYGREVPTAPAKNEYDNHDQRIHVDYPNHTLVHPPQWDRPEAVEMLLYLSDVDECGGATALVPRRNDSDPAYRYPIVDTPGVGELEWMNDRESSEAYLREAAPEVARFRAEQLYSREVRARYRFGTLLLYRHDTWHRGTPLQPGTIRLAQNLTFRKATSEWISVLHPGWAWAMYRRGQPIERLIANASTLQRCVLGFPAPGHSYWTRETLAAVRARYAPLGMDMAPYEDGTREHPGRPHPADSSEGCR